MENRKNGVLVLGVLWSVLFCAGLGPGQANAQSQYPEQILRFAEVVLYNGKILTMDRDDTNFSIQEAVAVRDEMLDRLSDLTIPDSPLDQILNNFGPAKVAEITGRSRRLIRDPKTGKREWLRRSSKGVPQSAVNTHEMDQFQSGKKRVAVISGAGSTGISLHAWKRALNKQRRVFLTAELSWSADQQLQFFGRVHRSDQAAPPIFDLISTSAGGEKRFSSTIARRLGSLGALSKGQRDATGGGELAKYNFETFEGEAALQRLYGDLTGRGEGVKGIEDGPGVLVDMGLIKERGTTVDGKDARDVPRFLNRILALDLDRQNALFDAFAERFDRAVRLARENGTFDEGVASIKGKSIRFKGSLRSTEPYLWRLPFSRRIPGSMDRSVSPGSVRQRRVRREGE